MLALFLAFHGSYKAPRNVIARRATDSVTVFIFVLTSSCLRLPKNRPLVFESNKSIPALAIA
jgi:hypothetical protein